MSGFKEELDGGVDPLSLAMFVLLSMTAHKALTGWREEWQKRTNVGRVGLLLASPVRIVSGILGIALAIVFGVIIVAEALVFAIPRTLYHAYQNRAFKEECEIE